jgi:hypothetical protein
MPLNYFNFLGIILIFLAQYTLLCYWAPFINSIRLGVYFAYVDSTPWYFLNVIGTMWHNVSFIFVRLPSVWIRDPKSFFPPLFFIYQAGPDDGKPPVFMYHLANLTNLLPNFSRLSIMAVFIASFFLRPLQRPIMTLWARIIESEKPVFTLLFGGIAAIAKAIQQISGVC